MSVFSRICALDKSIRDHHQRFNWQCIFKRDQIAHSLAVQVIPYLTKSELFLSFYFALTAADK